tara:strand:- start:23203 stop:23886 length:684 start_codon:yes stop_codon:yes gene_type:complete
MGGCRHSEKDFKIFVASSMTEFVDILLPELTDRYPGLQVQINIAGSGTLVNQIVEGADADVVLLAGANHMARLQAENAFLPPVPIARNSLTVVVSSNLAESVTTISDLRDAGLQGAVCVPGAPCGELAVAFARAVNLDLSNATREPNVKAVLSKVVRGEVDYGFVYRSDALMAANEVKAIEAEGLDSFTTSYSLALKNSDEVSVSFLEVVTQSKVSRVLEELGFLSR